jgi:putative membrane protein
VTKVAAWLLSAGLVLFIAVLASQGLAGIVATLSRAGWGLLLVALFHAIPLLLDALAISILFEPSGRGGTFRDALLARWAGESANSLMPVGQIGGPVLMTRQLERRGLRLPVAAAVITVSTTLQTFAQIAFALLGVVLLGAATGPLSAYTLRSSSLIASGVLAVQVGGFYLMQRRGLFGKLARMASKVSVKRDWSAWLRHAESIDSAIDATYRRGGAVAGSFLLSFLGWVVGTGEVVLILLFIGHPVTWVQALLLESLGQAIRGAAFAIPGALGVQEGGYLLLAPLAGLPPDAALALSLAKRTREILLGVPGLFYLRFSGRRADAVAST